MQKVSPLVSRLIPTTSPLDWTLFHPPLALLPSEKTGGFALTVMKTTTLSNIVGIHSTIHSFMKAAISTLSLTKLATMTRTGVGKHT